MTKPSRDDLYVLLCFVEDVRAVLVHLRRLDERGVDGVCLPRQELEAAIERLEKEKK